MDLNDLPKITMTVLLAGMFFVIGLVILSSMQATTNIGSSATIINETFTAPVQGGTFTLAHMYLTSISSITNSSNATLGTGNYSISDYTNSVVTLVSNASCTTGMTCKISYTYTTNNETVAGVAVAKSITALSEIPNNWLLLIVVVICAVVVIGIVMDNLKNNVGRN